MSPPGASVGAPSRVSRAWHAGARSSQAYRGSRGAARPRTAFVLSGGASLGALQVGMLQGDVRDRGYGRPEADGVPLVHGVVPLRGRQPSQGGGKMLNLSTVMIGSEDPKALSEFYTKVLGEPAWQDGGYVGWQAGNATLMIGPHSEVKGRNEMPGRIILNFETPDVQAEYERLRGLGVGVYKEPYRPAEAADLWLATLEDPDGNYFQLASPMPAQ